MHIQDLTTLLGVYNVVKMMMMMMMMMYLKNRWQQKKILDWPWMHNQDITSFGCLQHCVNDDDDDGCEFNR